MLSIGGNDEVNVSVIWARILRSIKLIENSDNDRL